MTITGLLIIAALMLVVAFYYGYNTGLADGLRHTNFDHCDCDDCTQCNKSCAEKERFNNKY